MNATPFPSFGQRFWPVFAAGLLGVLALPLTFPAAVEANLRAAVPAIAPGVLKALTLIQPALLLAAGAALGAALAHRLGLASHLARVNLRRRLVDELPLAIAAGLVVGGAIVALDRTVFLGPAPREAASLPSVVEGLAGGMLYGGLTEEVLMRWGLLSLVAATMLKLARRRFDAQPRIVYVIAIALVALIFAAGHLPAASVIAPLDAPLVTRILVLNGIAGVIYGALFWRRSLEAAMAAHTATHVAFAIARVMRWA
jgi:hypothetical protein